MKSGISEKDCRDLRHSLRNEMTKMINIVIDKQEAIQQDISIIKQEGVARSKDIAKWEEQTHHFNRLSQDISKGYVSRWAFNIFLGIIMAISGYIVAMTNLNNNKIGIITDKVIQIQAILNNYDIKVE